MGFKWPLWVSKVPHFPRLPRHAPLHPPRSFETHSGPSKSISIEQRSFESHFHGGPLNGGPLKPISILRIMKDMLLYTNAFELFLPSTSFHSQVRLGTLPFYDFGDDRLRLDYHESRRCSRDTYPESYTTKYTSIRRSKSFASLNLKCIGPPSVLHRSWVLLMRWCVDPFMHPLHSPGSVYI